MVHSGPNYAHRRAGLDSGKLVLGACSLCTLKKKRAALADDFI